MKNKGFTLIELLAVIIIIGLIAVITIPKINKSVDDSKKNIAKASAYQYKKAVNEYTIGQQLNKNIIELNGEYEITENGYLYNNNNTIEVDFSGEKPKNGYLTYINNELQSGCITINKYAATFENGEVSNIEKGDCEKIQQELVSQKIDSYVKAALTANSSLESSKRKTVADLSDITTNKPDSGWIEFEVSSQTVSVKNYSLKYGKLIAKYSSLTNGTYVSTFEFLKSITLKEGDLVEMTPTLQSFTTDTAFTGAAYTETIYPQRLHLWRVIRVNGDGTYDAVSEYSSAEIITFNQTGSDSSCSTCKTGGTNVYKYYIYYLNVLASKYENNEFTVGSRYMGYNGQTQTIEDTSAFDGTSNSAPWTCSTEESCNPNETLGGGDTGYTTDLDLVKSVYNNSAVAYKVDANGNPTSTEGQYWLASRRYYWNDASYFMFYGRIISYSSLGRVNFRVYNSSWSSSAFSYCLRPIITLKSNLTATGSGTSEEPYVLY